MAEFDIVNRPKHYNSHPSGVECHTIADPFGYYLGNAVKYIWRCGLKESGTEIQDLKKAIWYLNAQIAKLAVTEAIKEPKRTVDVTDKRPDANESALARLRASMAEADKDRAEAEANEKDARKNVMGLDDVFTSIDKADTVKITSTLDVKEGREETVIIHRNMDGALERVTKKTTMNVQAYEAQDQGAVEGGWAGEAPPTTSGRYRKDGLCEQPTDIRL